MEETLLHWLRNVKRSQKMNYDSALYYSRLNLFLGIPVAILATIIGTSVFATLESEVDTIWRIATGLLSILAAALSSLQTFLAFGDRAAKHRAAAAEYGIIKREIEQSLISLKVNANIGVDELLSPVRDKIDRLAREAPLPPKKIHERAETNMPPKPFSDYFLKKSKKT